MIIKTDNTREKLAQTSASIASRASMTIIAIASVVLMAACSSSRSSGNSTPASTTTPTSSTLTASAKGQRAAGTLILTWTEPSPAVADFVGVSISSTNGIVTLAPVRVAKGTTTHTFTGLTGTSAFDFTISAVSGTALASGTVSTTAVVTITAAAVTADAFALFSLGKQNGSFGFAACQAALDDNAKTANLRSRGYTQARFFGSTPDYDFKNIATDADALATTASTTAGTTATGNIAVFTDTTGTTAPKRTFGASGSEAAVTLANMLGLASSGAFQNGGENVLTHLGVGILNDTSNYFWSLTMNSGVFAGNAFSCGGAASGRGFSKGTIGYATNITGTDIRDCDNTHYVLCIAR